MPQHQAHRSTTITSVRLGHGPAPVVVGPLPEGCRFAHRRTTDGPQPAPGGTVASGDHSNRRPPPESLNAIGDAKIDCFEHFWQPSGREAAPLWYPPTAPSGQMQQCRPWRPDGQAAGDSWADRGRGAPPQARAAGRCDVTAAASLALLLVAGPRVRAVSRLAPPAGAARSNLEAAARVTSLEATR
jgi:hypothetical protein